jgi:hypothetical protein
VRLEGLGKLKKKLIPLIGSRTRDLPVCSISAEASTVCLDVTVQFPNRSFDCLLGCHCVISQQKLRLFAWLSLCNFPTEAGTVCLAGTVQFPNRSWGCLLGPHCAISQQKLRLFAWPSLCNFPTEAATVCLAGTVQRKDVSPLPVKT